MFKKGTRKNFEILEIIHIDICCPYIDLYGQKYFILFIDDYLRYMHLYIFDNRHETLDTFKIFKTKVEK